MIGREPRSSAAAVSTDGAARLRAVRSVMLDLDGCVWFGS